MAERQVDLISLDQGTVEQFQIIREESMICRTHTAGHVLELLKTLKGPKLGFKVDRYEHSLQTATRALRDGADEEMVCVALLHDVGDTIAPDNHPDVAAALLRPYVSDVNHWLVLNHQAFQGYYYFHLIGRNRDAREKYRGHPAFETTAMFCERWDQRAFDPDYDTLPIETFEPMVQRLFMREPKGDKLFTTKPDAKPAAAE